MNGVSRGSVHSENSRVKLLSLQQERIEHSAVSRVPIKSLNAADSPRLDGEDAEHVRRLAESGAVLPPIVVHLPSRKVIDGMHRLRAAMLRGETDIQVRFFQGSESDVFLLAVAANIRHGLPLSQNDRMAAAGKIFISHPEWSDRMIADVVGLSGKRVADLRRSIADRTLQPAMRIGRDGRARPVDGSTGRERAAELLAAEPGASLRQIAREAGISPATAADVRDRISRGEDPVLTRRTTQPKATAHADRSLAPGAAEREQVASLIPALATGFNRLRKDPSLRFTEAGRALLRMFDACHTVVQDEDRMKQLLPPHCLTSVAELSYAYAAVLQSFAEDLQQLHAGESAPDLVST